MQSNKFDTFLKRYWPFIAAIIILWWLLRQCQKDHKACTAKKAAAAGGNNGTTGNTPVTTNPDPSHPGNLPQQLCQYDDDGKPIVCV